MITISHRHGEGTLLTGTCRGDGTNHVINSTGDGWRFSRRVGADGAWYLPRSRDRSPDHAKVQRLAAALAAAGYQVAVDVDDTPCPPEQQEADYAARATGRAAAYAERARRRQERGTRILADVDAERARIPPGQPDIRPVDANRRRKRLRREQAGLALVRAGQQWQRRAQAADTGLRYRHNPRVITRRLEALASEQRRARRQLEDLQAGGSHGEYAEGGAYAHLAGQATSRVRQRLADLQAQISYWRGELAAAEATGAWTPWQPQHFRAGDQALVASSWHVVVRVNRRSLTLQLPHADAQPRTGRVGYDAVYGRRRDGHTLHTPPPPPVPDADGTQPTDHGHHQPDPNLKGQHDGR